MSVPTKQTKEYYELTEVSHYLDSVGISGEDFAMFVTNGGAGSGSTHSIDVEEFLDEDNEELFEEDDWSLMQRVIDAMGWLNEGTIDFEFNW